MEKSLKLMGASLYDASHHGLYEHRLNQLVCFSPIDSFRKEGLGVAQSEHAGLVRLTITPGVREHV